MKILYFGSACDREWFNKVSKAKTMPYHVAQYMFEMALIEGFSNIDDIDRLSMGSYIGDDGKSHSYIKPMPERFWKYFKYKSKNYDDDIFRKKNLLFTGQISQEERKKVMKQIAKSEAYRNKKGK